MTRSSLSHPWLALAALAVLPSGCFDARVPDDVVVECKTTAECPSPDQVCFDELCRSSSDPCVLLEDGEGVAAPDGSACTRASEVGVCIAGVCAASTCGDGFVDASLGEECDDGLGNSTLPGACRPTCLDAVCGDGVIDLDELCDDGNEDDSDGCLSSCTVASCGDGVVFAGQEECDDGNTVETDDCLRTCVAASCGDGETRLGDEACDDGNAIDTDACKSDCTENVCGDGAVHLGVEECDDANPVDTDACKNDCTDNVCGDGVVFDGVEACDDGDAVETNACLSSCQEAFCGDGILHVGVEACDDGNLANDDACLSSCVLATCGDGVVWTDVEACDDGNPIDTDACRNTCEVARCGDGVLRTDLALGDPDFEACDDGNGVAVDDCLGTCRVNVCGDGILNYVAADECDDGNTDNFDGCSAQCRQLIWSVDLGAPLATPLMAVAPYDALARNREAPGPVEVLAAATVDGVVHLLDVLTGEVVVEVESLASEPTRPLFNGRYVLWATSDGRVHGVAPPVMVGASDGGSLDAGEADAGALDAGSAWGVPDFPPFELSLPDGVGPASHLVVEPIEDDSGFPSKSNIENAAVLVLGSDGKLYSVLPPLTETGGMVPPRFCDDCIVELLDITGATASPPPQARTGLTWIDRRLLIPMSGGLAVVATDEACPLTVTWYPLDPGEHVVGEAAYPYKRTAGNDEQEDSALATTTTGRIVGFSLPAADCTPAISTVPFDVPINDGCLFCGEVIPPTETVSYPPLVKGGGGVIWADSAGRAFLLRFDRAVLLDLNTDGIPGGGGPSAMGALDVEGAYYLADTSGRLHKLSALTGLPQWSTLMPTADGGPALLSGSPLAHMGAVFVGTRDGRLLAYERGGTASPMIDSYSREGSDIANGGVANCSLLGPAGAPAALLLAVLGLARGRRARRKRG